MAYHFRNLVFEGGGVKGIAYIGALEVLDKKGIMSDIQRFGGTSAGAINTVVLASKARRFRVAVAELEKVWGHFHCDQVYRTDSLRMLKSSLHWFASIILGGMLVGTPRSLLDNSPLRSLLSQNVRFPRIQASIEAGHLHAVAVTAAGYGSSRSTTFFQASPDVPPWSRTRRVGMRRDLHLDHLMASIAVPMIFPPVRIDGE